MLAAETALELAEKQRRRTILRMDGGAGTDEQFLWLFARGYHVVAKGLAHSRVAVLARRATRWDAYDGYDLAEVPPPIDYGRPVRVFVKRYLRNDKMSYSYYVNTLQKSSKGLFLQDYHLRGGAEVELFRQDKQGLSLSARRMSSFTGQMALVLLADLAHNLLSHFRYHALAASPFADWGLKRVVRDLLHIPGRFIFANGQLVRIELLSLNQNARNLIICLERSCSAK